MSKYEYIPIGEEGALLQIKGNCKIVFFTFFIGNFSKKSKKVPTEEQAQQEKMYLRVFLPSIISTFDLRFRSS